MCRDRRSKELLSRWQAGDQTAATELYRRYAERLCTLADRLLSRDLSARVQADDIAQSAMRTFFRRTSAAEYEVDESASLWNLLVQITLNKARRYAKHHRADKRDIGREARISPEHCAEWLAHLPSHEEAVQLTEELSSVLATLTARDQRIVQLRLSGHQLSEIAAEIECARRTVSLVLERIGELLARRLSENSEKFP